MKIKIILGGLLILIAIFLLTHSFSPKKTPPTQTVSDQPTITSTTPSPLEGSLITPTQAIVVVFSTPLQNIPEFRYKMDPPTDLNLALSNDRKTATFTPKSYFDLSTAYTLFIYQDSKFDGDKLLDHDYIFHFHTPNYTGV